MKILKTESKLVLFSITTLFMALNANCAPADDNLSIALPTCNQLSDTVRWCAEKDTVNGQTVYSISVETPTQTIELSSNKTYEGLNPKKFSKGLKHFAKESGLNAVEAAHVMGPVAKELNAIDSGQKNQEQVALYIARWVARTN